MPDKQISGTNHLLNNNFHILKINSAIEITCSWDKHIDFKKFNLQDFKNYFSLHKTLSF